VPRELRARENNRGSYHGLMSAPRPVRPLDRMLRAVLEAEGALIARGVALPFGRALFALCRKRP
jgi:hypothetical protein